jgi:hypothetical protein
MVLWYVDSLLGNGHEISSYTITFLTIGSVNNDPCYVIAATDTYVTIE